ncbi:hypothetical protein DFJ58DRAFT_424268 [Suillus subalutaceus]|uniref:uncharacterized protein n=1 Tax=Suillus subalutaceus TaxID=48586 RepID=UPI001B86BE50|nr:uncharacterized protein DFJ58DRAFT_424268 [Suillus subalutaceus]KAG1851467.1 hypothetical protein DFJ58DRAFT_424268 [Suillus subalutaceus]
MAFFFTPRSSSSPPDDELAVPGSPYRRDHPNAMSSFNCPVRTSPPSDPSTSSNGARRFPSPGRGDTGTSGVAANMFGSATANTLGYHFNTSTYFAHLNGYMGSNISSNRDFPYRSEEATTTQSMMDDITRQQDYHPTADPIHYGSYCELQPSSGYGDPVHNPLSWYGAEYHNAAQGGVDAWYPSTPVTGGNPSPSDIPPTIQMAVLLIDPNMSSPAQIHPPAPTMSHSPTTVNLNHPPIILGCIMARGHDARTMPSVIRK